MLDRPRRKILIVDDEPDLLDAMALRLSVDGGFEVAVAHDGDEGVREALRFRPDTALVDLSMPGMDGWALCRRLHVDLRTRRIKVVIMTAWLAPDLRRRALSEGVPQLLLKPFEESELLEALGAEPAAVGVGEGGALP